MYVRVCVHILPYHAIKFLDLCVTVSMLHNYAYVLLVCFPKVKCMLDVYSVKQPSIFSNPSIFSFFLVLGVFSLMGEKDHGLSNENN